jgi:hypothetical protein
VESANAGVLALADGRDVERPVPRAKELVWLPAGNHIDLYDDESLVQSPVDATLAFLVARS